MKRFRNGRLTLVALSIVVSGCNGLSAVHPTTHANTDTSRFSDVAHVASLANKQILVVSEASPGPPSLSTFPADANGTPTPIRLIAGSNTGIFFPWRGVILGNGRLWVISQVRPEQLGSARAFSPTANGNAHPFEVVRCFFNMDGGTIGIDGQGFIYVAGVNDNVYVYPPGAQGCVQPLRDITGAHTLLNGPFISVDATGKVYSANYFAKSVTAYAPGSTGDVTPILDVTGRATHLVNPAAVAVDANGEVFVLDTNQPASFSSNVKVFAPGATGNVAPIREIKGPATRLVHSTSLAVSSDGWVFVANARAGPGLIAVFAPGANGDVAPTHVINGSRNSFGYPIGVAIQP
jgi:hypothetical protein